MPLIILPLCHGSLQIVKAIARAYMRYYFAYIAAETHIFAIRVVLQDAFDPPFRPVCVPLIESTAPAGRLGGREEMTRKSDTHPQRESEQERQREAERGVGDR